MKTDFENHLEFCGEIVSKWPKWKQEVLGDKIMYEKHELEKWFEDTLEISGTVEVDLTEQQIKFRFAAWDEENSYFISLIEMKVLAEKFETNDIVVSVDEAYEDEVYMLLTINYDI